MLPDGSVNPTYDQEIETGLCGCLGFAEGVNIDGNQVTFSVVIVDNEPIRGIELNIHHNTDSTNFQDGYILGKFTNDLYSYTYNINHNTNLNIYSIFIIIAT